MLALQANHPLLRWNRDVPCDHERLHAFAERDGHADRRSWPAAELERDLDPRADKQDLQQLHWCDRLHLIRAAVWIKREGASKGAPSFFVTSSAPIDSSPILPRALARDDLVLPVNAE